MSSFTQFLLVCKWAATWISSTTYVFISIIFFFLRFLPISANLIDICFESVQIKQCAWSVHSDVFECESCLALLWFKLSSKPCHSKALSTIMQINHSANIYLFRFINRNNRKRCGICSKLTIKHQNDFNDVVVMFLLLTLKIFHTLFWCFYTWLWTSKYNVLKIKKWLIT